MLACTPTNTMFTTQGIQEFQEQLPLITGFASAYAEVNAEQAQNAQGHHYSSLCFSSRRATLSWKYLHRGSLLGFTE